MELPLGQTVVRIRDEGCQRAARLVDSTPDLRSERFGCALLCESCIHLSLLVACRSSGVFAVLLFS